MNCASVIRIPRSQWRRSDSVASLTLSSLPFHGDLRPRVSSRFGESLHPSQNFKILVCRPRYYDVKFLGSSWNSNVRVCPADGSIFVSEIRNTRRKCAVTKESRASHSSQKSSSKIIINLFYPLLAAVYEKFGIKGAHVNAQSARLYDDPCECVEKRNGVVKLGGRRARGIQRYIRSPIKLVDIGRQIIPRLRQILRRTISNCGQFRAIRLRLEKQAAEAA